MTAEIEINQTTGRASYFGVGEPAWHRLGVTLNAPPTVREAIRLAGLDWKVRLQPLHMNYDGEEMPVPGYATVRDSDRSVLGVVGPTYKPLQNEDAFDFFQPWLDKGLATLETAGSLREGRRVWVLAKLKSDNLTVVKGDEISKYILLSNGHDGTLAVRAGFTPIRVVCANTMAMAHAEGTSKLMRVRHNKNTVKALDEIRDIMNVAEQSFEASAEQFRAMTRYGVCTDDLRTYVRQVFKPKLIQGGPAAIVEAEAEDCDRLMGKIIPLFEQGRGNNLPGVAGTLWGAYNAVNEYLAYERGSTEGGRLHSLWFGDSALTNQRALQVAQKMLAVG